jgi:hypothetical protein
LPLRWPEKLPDYIRLIAALSFELTCSAIDSNPGLFTACIETAGLIAATSAPTPSISWTITLQGHGPILSSLEGLVREMRVTCSQNAVSPEINAQFLFQRVFNINFRQDTESFFFQFLENPADSVVKGRLYGLAKVV